MKNSILWIVFFLICMAVGFLHGVLPQGITRDSFFIAQKIHVLTTDEILFPAEIRTKLEEKLHVKFTVTVARDWNSLIAQTVSSPSVDLIFMPSYWAQSLNQQNLLWDLKESNLDFSKKVSSDFLSQQQMGLTFFPIYWFKTKIQTPNSEDFEVFLKNKKETSLYLLADEDLILKHFQIWKEQGLLETVLQKKILTLPLDRLLKNLPADGAAEEPVQDKDLDSQRPQLSALLIWGAGIPKNSDNKSLTTEVLDYLSSSELQEDTLLNTPFNTSFASVTGDNIPLHRRAEFIRNLQLKNTLLLEFKDQEAIKKLRSDFNFSF